MMDRAKRLFTANPELTSPMIITKPENIRYFSGFTGEGALVLTGEKNTVITDFRYTEQAESQSPGWEIIQTSRDLRLPAAIGRALNASGAKSAYYESDHVTVKMLKDLSEALEGIELMEASDAADAARAIKSAEEIELHRRAAALTDQAFEYILTRLRPGVTEMQLKAELDFYFVTHGAEGASFNAIIASGPNGSLPHAEPSERKIEIGDFVTFDFGCKIGGYCSDFTRTVAVGKVDPKLDAIYQVVLQAQLAGVAAVRPGIEAGAVDKVCRDIITDAGYGENFGHGTGHGVGLLIHEAPRLGVDSDTVLKPGMIVTVEPGIYLPGIGGVRIEDLVCVTETGCEVLSRYAKELITV